jgi:Uma2 family endonuclease
MAKVLEANQLTNEQFILPFQTGDRLTRSEFHKLYLQTPKHIKAELIQGVVYVASPASYQHGKNDRGLGTIMDIYNAYTPGTDGASNVTIQLDDASEVQPDQHLRIRDEYGGLSTLTAEGYLVGAPELVAEVSLSTLSHDLNTKKKLYADQGVLEYLVVDLQNERLHWFDLPQDQELALDTDEVLRSRVFPGFWVDSQALFRGDRLRLMATLQTGLATPEHAVFVQQLAARRTLPPQPGI